MPGVNEYQYDGKDLQVTDAMKADFDRDGFVVIRNLLSQQELDIVEDSIQGDLSLSTYAYRKDDGEGRKSRMCLWNKVGKDNTGALASTRKLAGTASKLLGSEVFHYHSKITMKDAHTGGKFLWHQDYAYWYKFGCLFPDMLTAFVALDRCDTDNGCLQVIRGSHRCGRIEHGHVAGGDQEGADLERVAELEKRLEKLPVPLNAGDALIFHCNVLHCSSHNASDRRRWAILACYNAAHNSPTTDNFHSQYTPLEILANDAVIKRGVSRDLTGKEVLVREPGELKFRAYYK